MPASQVSAPSVAFLWWPPSDLGPPCSGGAHIPRDPVSPAEKVAHVTLVLCDRGAEGTRVSNADQAAGAGAELGEDVSAGVLLGTEAAWECCLLLLPLK